MSVKVKICGIRDVETAEACVDAKADFIGMNFVPYSRSYITLEAAEQMAAAVRGKVNLVGIFVDSPLNTVNGVAETIGLDYVQLHGSETTDYCSKVNVPIIKAFGLDPDFAVDAAVNKMRLYDVDYHLIDRNNRGHGEILDLQRARTLAEKFRLMFAGGLMPDNAAEVVKQVEPDAVDVSSGVETNNRKDPGKISIFVSEVKNAV